MSADLLVSRWTQPARLRGAWNDVLLWSPAVVVAGALAWRWGGGLALCLATILGTAILAGVAFRRTRRFDRRWLIRRLDADRPEAEDSADLLFADEAGLGRLQRLQQERLRRRLTEDDAAALKPAWSTHRIGASWTAGLLLAAAILLWPAGDGGALLPGDETPAAAGDAATQPRLLSQRLRIVPPAYTGLPAREQAGLDVRAPQGSRLIWLLRFAPDPEGASLTFHNGERLDFAREGGSWNATRLLTSSTLYRLTVTGAGGKLPPLHRLEAVADAPPQIKLLQPDRILSLMTPGQRTWSPSFEVTDDYGVATAGQLRITVTQGEGENITFRETMASVRGTGTARRKSFTANLNLAALGLDRGGDLVVHLTASDNRSPGPQTVRGPSLILRWPADLGQEAGGLEGMMKTVLPAYFRSQRQIIIDAEALIKERRQLANERFLDRSDAIGVDQRLLRLRYGQFLGEEAEGGSPPPPTNDVVEEDADGAAPAGDDHDHGHAGEEGGAAQPGFGASADVLEEFGHTHDESEAATLLDPDTRATLKQALDQMWQSELHLRQGDPAGALPYAYKALGFIKEVQQAERIYLARVGPELPPIDPARRLTGDRAGLERRALAPTAREAADEAPAALWRALESPLGGRALPLDATERWLRVNEGRVPDPLAILAAIDAVRRDPACTGCRRTLRGLLWTALSRPTPAVQRRQQSTAGRRYLDALRRGGGR